MFNKDRGSKIRLTAIVISFVILGICLSGCGNGSKAAGLSLQSVKSVLNIYDIEWYLSHSEYDTSLNSCNVYDCSPAIPFVFVQLDGHDDYLLAFVFDTEGFFAGTETGDSFDSFDVYKIPISEYGQNAFGDTIKTGIISIPEEDFESKAYFRYGFEGEDKISDWIFDIYFEDGLWPYNSVNTISFNASLDAKRPESGMVLIHQVDSINDFLSDKYIRDNIKGDDKFLEYSKDINGNSESYHFSYDTEPALIQSMEYIQNNDEGPFTTYEYEWKEYDGCWVCSKVTVTYNYLNPQEVSVFEASHSDNGTTVYTCSSKQP